MSTRVPSRRVRFTWSDDVDPVWTPRVPEMAIAANAVSLLMPHAEPYVVASVRAALRDPGCGLTGADAQDLAADAEAYVTQEAQHHAQHRLFNRYLLARYPALERLDRLEAALFGRLRRRGTRFGLAYAAAFETIAFIAARWVDRNRALLTDADPGPATLFLWHLAEEVEHKEVAFDVYETSGGGRLRYAAAMITAGVTLSAAAWAATLVMLAGEGKLLSPGSHLRLGRWSLSFIFAALPVMVISALPGHHPRQLADPIGFDHWLENLDPATSSVPAWALP